MKNRAAPEPERDRVRRAEKKLLAASGAPGAEPDHALTLEKAVADWKAARAAETLEPTGERCAH